MPHVILNNTGKTETPTESYSPRNIKLKMLTVIETLSNYSLFPSGPH